MSSFSIGLALIQFLGWVGPISCLDGRVGSSNPIFCLVVGLRGWVGCHFNTIDGGSHLSSVMVHMHFIFIFIFSFVPYLLCLPTSPRHPPSLARCCHPPPPLSARSASATQPILPHRASVLCTARSEPLWPLRCSSSRLELRVTLANRSCYVAEPQAASPCTASPQLELASRPSSSPG